MTGRGDAQRVSIVRTFGSPLKILAVAPILGRGFSEAEERGEGDPVVLLSHRFWRERLGGKADAVGQSLTLSKKVHTVIGVLPPDLDYPEGLELMSPAEPDFQKQGRQGNWFQIAARLRPGVDAQQARAQLAGIAARMAHAHPETDRRLQARLEPLRSAEQGQAGQAAWLLMGVVAFVLLIACLNIASLLVARAAERARETAIRASLGAGRLPLIRLFLLESLWLALLGGGLGICLTYWGVDVLKGILPPDMPRLSGIHVDVRVVLFTMAATLVCGLLFGVLPALQATSGGASALLREGRGTVNPRRRQRTRWFLVAAQTGLSMVLLVNAGLVIRGFLEMRGLPLGFAPERRLAVSIQFPWSTPAETLHQFNERVLEEFARIPGVRRVGLTDRLPLEGESQSGAIAIRGVDLPDALRGAPVDNRSVSAGYFQSVGQALVRGRLFDDARIKKESEAEVVVNRAFVERYLPSLEPLDQLLTSDVRPKPGAGPRYARIVGIVEDVRRSPQDAAARPAVYGSYRRTYWPLDEFVIEGAGDGPPERLATEVRAAVKRIDPNQPIQSIRSLEFSLRESQSPARIKAALMGAFALGGLLLAVLGLYGLLSSDVAQRTQEIGVRLALGASSSQLVAMLVRQGAAIAGAGLVVGLAASIAAGRVLAGAISGIPALDWATPFVAGAVLLAAAALASLLPARRAASVDPAVALRRD